jgi:hypothetical protein
VFAAVEGVDEMGPRYPVVVVRTRSVVEGLGAVVVVSGAVVTGTVVVVSGAVVTGTVVVVSGAVVTGTVVAVVVVVCSDSATENVWSVSVTSA